MVTVTHVTSVHPPRDIRIYWKDRVSLAATGYDAALVAPSDANVDEHGVKIIAVLASWNPLRTLWRHASRQWAIYHEVKTCRPAGAVVTGSEPLADVLNEVIQRR